MRERNIMIRVMLNDIEFKHLEGQLRTTGLNISSLLRKLILEMNIKAKPPDAYFDVYRFVSNIANNTNQIAHVANATGYINQEQIDTLLIMVEKCWQRIKELR